jgi:hypothetical protein
MSQSEPTDNNMKFAEKALQRGGDESLAARFAEARTVAGCDLGPSPQRDASLNWAGGQHLATEAGPGDRPLSAELANTAGVGSTAGIEQSSTRTPPSNVRPVPRCDQGQRSGVEAIVRGG